MAKTIITLGREYCTGGRYIAEDVANALGIKLYDKELITMQQSTPVFRKKLLPPVKNGILTACCTVCTPWAMSCRWAIRCSFFRAASSSSWPRKAPA